MSWARLDDTFPENKKLLGATGADTRVPVAISVVLTAIQVRAICYSSRNLTDGLVPFGAIPGILAGIDGDRWPERMVDAGLWEVCKAHAPIHKNKISTGFFIHDFLDYNPSKKKRKEASQKAKDAANYRWNKDKDTVRKPMQSACDSHTTSHEKKSDPDPLLTTTTTTPPISPPTTSKTKKKKRSRKKTVSDPNCPDCRALIALLNELTGKNYEGSGKALPMIHARHEEKGMLLCERVVRVKSWKWMGTEHEDFLRPETLFRPTKFDAYVNESIPKATPPPEVDKFSGSGKEEMRSWEAKHGRITPERRTAGISYLKHQISEVENSLSQGQKVSELDLHGGRSGKKEDLDALAKKLEDLRRELVFLEAGKGIGDE